ncbi:MAG: bifunctional indole-3-glycerol phosphate synthase/phosphoribosylanthranilate isomerase [Bacteroidales bacterium]|jgi:indole-3-glycerol phosphate synthase|nr:bifunctional indole-3-glycerol phosphate synthase/phosphoribosylanthranilate isomerase [Bacteroidales bacterium]
MNILDKIVGFKYEEVEGLRSRESFDSIYARARACNISVPSFKEAISAEGSSGIIAEFKRKSPSKGNINTDADISEVAAGYFLGGAAAMSVLTDRRFFGGSLADLESARKATRGKLPLLRKDFVVDEYQICQARLAAASAVLLIAAILDKHKKERLAALAHELNMETILEIHNEDELEYLYLDDGTPDPNIDIAGINNRDLKKFVTDISASLNLAEKIPSYFIKISESGISSPCTVRILHKKGYSGFLIGENFMRTSRPQEALSEFIKETIRDGMELKICGMRDPENIIRASALKPAYIGFIFYEKSERFAGFRNELLKKAMEEMPSAVRKTGVFVNTDIKSVLDTAEYYGLDAIQLHGTESPGYCRNIKENIKGEIKIIKAIAISENTNGDVYDPESGHINQLCHPYIDCCDYFLFDTKTTLTPVNIQGGGTGACFDHDLLKKYNIGKPYFVSGGIDMEDAGKIMQMKTHGFFPFMSGIDVNSKFERGPGYKDIKKLKLLKKIIEK